MAGLRNREREGNTVENVPVFLGSFSQVRCGLVPGTAMAAGCLSTARAHAFPYWIVCPLLMNWKEFFIHSECDSFL